MRSRCRIRSMAVMVQLVLLAAASVVRAYDQAWDQGHTNYTPVDPGNPYGDPTGTGGGDPGGDFDVDDPDDTEPGPDEDEEEDCCKQNKGSPFLLNTGRVSHVEEDMVLPGRGPMLQIKRTFNGADISDGLVGKSWYFYYGKVIAQLKNSRGDSFLYIRWKNGQKYRFRATGLGYESIEGKVAPSFTVRDEPGGGWRILEKNGQVSVFNANGSLVSVTDENGLAITVTHTANGCPNRATNAAGNYFDFTYTPNGKLGKVTDNFGRSVSFTYDGSGNLIAAQYSDGGKISYGYDAGDRLISSTDYEGNTLWEVTYHPQSTNPADYNRGRVATFTREGMKYRVQYYAGYLTETDSLNNRTTIYYDERGVVTEKLYPDGSRIRRKPSTILPDAVEWYEDENGNRSSYTYDEKGNMVSFTSATGDMWRWTFDHMSRRTREIAPDGRTTKWEYDENGNTLRIVIAAGTSQEASVTFTYDADGKMLTMTDGKGNVTTYAYDSDGNKILEVKPTGDSLSWTYDSLGRMVASSDGAGAGWRYFYDQRGNKVKQINPLGDSITWQYDLNGNVVEETDYAGNTSSYGYDRFSRVTHRTDPMGDTSYYEYNHEGKTTMAKVPGQRPVYQIYDRRGRMTYLVQKVGEDTIANRTYPTSDTDDLITQYTYDKAGNVLTVRDPNGRTTTFAYDAMNRRISSRDPAGQTTKYYYTDANRDTLMEYPNGNWVRKVYDNAGRLTRMIDSLGVLASVTYDRNGNRLTTSVPGKGTLRTTYDALNRKVMEQDSSGKRVTYTYDGNGRLSSRSDGNATTYYGYDALGRDAWEANALGDTVRFEYDKLGNRTKVTDADGNVTAYEFDALGRNTKITLPDGGVKTMEYDKAAQIVKITTPGAVVVTQTYDEVGRLVGRSNSDGTPSDTFTYDKGGNLLTANNSVAQLTYTYDYVGNPTRITEVVDGTTYTVQYAYNTTSRTTTVTYPNSKRLDRIADLRNRLLSAVWYYRDTVATLTYDGMNVATKRLGNGVVADYEFAHGNIASISYSHAKATGLPDFTYSYATTGLRKAKRDVANPGSSETYGYDAANRLTAFRRGAMSTGGTIGTPDVDQVWELDSRYNWSKFTGNGTAETRKHNGVNEITESSAHTVKWDDNGNLSDLDGTLFTWDALNRLEKSGSNEYAYDARGNRVKRTLADGSVHHYVYGDNNQVLYEKKVGGGAKWFAYGDYVDEVLGMQSDSAGKYYYLVDGQYSVIGVTDTGGHTLESYEYDPYGRMTIYDADGTEIDESAIDNPYTFTGRRYDPETGLYYFRARYHSPDIGRFANRDPMGYIDGYNLYPAYFVVNAVDPTGQAKCEVVSVHQPKVSLDVYAWQVKVTGSIEFKTNLKRCRVCCGPGTARAGDWVTHQELSVTIQIGAEVEGKSFGTGFSALGVEGDFWLGVKVTGGISITGSGELIGRECDGKGPEGKICATGEGYVAIALGGEASLKVKKGWFEISATAGLNATGKGSVTVKQCLTCPNGLGSCKRDPVELCFQAAITATVSAFFISYTWEFWEGKVCPLP